MSIRPVIGWLVGFSAAWLWGCGAPASNWQFDYDQAIHQAREAERDVLILYKDPLETRSGAVRDILESPEMAPRIGHKVRLMLVPYYAPNVRFMSQFGITEAPAIAVVHPDNTYHALAGVHTADEVASFLESAKGPGKQPTLDPQIPRQQTIEFFNTFERARDKAARQNRRLFIVYKWWLDAQSTELIRRITTEHVARYFSESVNCILDWDHAPNREHAARYGVREYPAMIIVEPDGSFRMLPGVPSDEAIIRFATARHAGSAPSSRTGAGGETDDRDGAGDGG